MKRLIIKALVCLCPVRKWRKQLRSRYLPVNMGNPNSKQARFPAQFGEDLILNFALSILKKRNLVDEINYLDIGANHPIAGNNTFFLYAQGYSGVIVEPNPVLFCAYSRIRPRDIGLNIGIHYTSDTIDSLPFYRFIEDPGLSSFDKTAADLVLKNMPAIKSYEVIQTKIKSINSVIDEYFGGKAPTFISIDCEGIDFEIIKSFDFKKYRPVLLCAETADPCVGGLGRKSQDVLDFMRSMGYEVYADTYVNTIFIEKHVLSKMYV
ncbi:MAG: FkbM family methyltransferase [Clostridia bacterium]